METKELTSKDNLIEDVRKYILSFILENFSNTPKDIANNRVGYEKKTNCFTFKTKAIHNYIAFVKQFTALSYSDLSLIIEKLAVKRVTALSYNTEEGIKFEHVTLFCISKDSFTQKELEPLNE